MSNQENEDQKQQENSNVFQKLIREFLSKWYIHAFYLFLFTSYYIPNFLYELGIIEQSIKFYVIILVIIIWAITFLIILLYARKIAKGKLQNKITDFAFNKGYDKGVLDSEPPKLLKEILNSASDFITDLKNLNMENYSDEILAELPKQPRSWVKFIKYGYGKPEHENNTLWVILTTSLIKTYLQRLAEIRGDDIDTEID